MREPYGGRHDRPEGARPGDRGRPRVAVGADPGRRHGSAARGATGRARADAPPLPPVVPVLDFGRMDRHPRRRPLRDALHPHRRPRRVGAGADAGRRVGVAPAAGVRRRRLARPDADRLRGDARGDHRSVGPGPPAPGPPRVDAGAVRFAARRGGCGPGVVAVRAVSDELPPDRRPRGRDDGRRRRLARPARARIRVGRSRRRAVDDDGARVLRGSRRDLGATRAARIARPSAAGARRSCALLTCAMCS